MAFQTTLPKDLAVRNALREVFKSDAAHGAELLQRSSAEPLDHDSGDHIAESS